MNIEQLENIVEVTKTKSFAVASKNLHITQSAISQSISKLEKELGVKLFTRSRSGTIPTSEGQIIIQKAFEIIKNIEEIRVEAQNQSDNHEGELRIVTIPIVMDSLVKMISSLIKDYPKVKFEISELGSNEIMNKISENKVDLGLIALKKDSFVKEKGICFEPFLEGKIVVGVGKNSPLATRKSITPQEMLEYPYVIYNEVYNREFLEHFSKTVGPVQLMFTTNNVSAILNALIDDIAITVGYDFSFFNAPSVSNGDIVTLEIKNYEQHPIVLGWVKSEKLRNSSFYQYFIDRLIQAFEEVNL